MLTFELSAMVWSNRDFLYSLILSMKVGDFVQFLISIFSRSRILELKKSSVFSFNVLASSIPSLKGLEIVSITLLDA